MLKYNAWQLSDFWQQALVYKPFAQTAGNSFSFAAVAISQHIPLQSSAAASKVGCDARSAEEFTYFVPQQICLQKPAAWVSKTANPCYPGQMVIVCLTSCTVLCLQIGLVPGLSVGMGDGGPGCFAATDGVTRVRPFHHRTQCLCIYCLNVSGICCLVSGRSCLQASGI